MSRAVIRTGGAAQTGGTQAAPRRGIPGHPNAWRVYLAVGLAAIAVYFWLPGSVQAVWYDLFGASAVAAILIGVRRHRPARARPWHTAAGGLLLLVVGDVILNAYESVLHVPLPFPSVADGFFLVGNLTVAIGLVLLIRSRVPGGDTGSLIDAAIVASGAGVLAWIFLMAPYAADPSLSLIQLLASLAYPFMDVLMLAVAARLAFSPGVRTPSFNLVLLALLSTLVADVIYAELVLTGNYSPGNPVDGIWLLWYVSWGTAALHPSMRALTDPGPVWHARLTRRRLVLLAAAVLLAPAARAIQWVRAEPVDPLVISLASAVMSLLVLIRMSGLIRSMDAARRELERAVEREQILREAAAALVATPSRDGIYAATLDAAAALVRDPEAQVRVALHATGELRVMAAAGGRSAVLEGARVDLATLPAPTYTSLLAQQSARLERTAAPELWEKLALDPEQRTAFLTPLVIQQELRGVLVVTGATPLPDRVSGLLEALGSQVALALEGAALAEGLHQRKSEERFRSLVRNASDVILVTEADGTVRYASPSVERVLGYRDDDLVGTSSFALIHPDDRERMRDFHAEIVTTTGTTRAVEYRVRHGGGVWHHVEAIGNNLLDEPSVRGIVINARDISERKRAEGLMAHQAFHDRLTGLPNRALFMDRLEHALVRSLRDRATVGVLFLDLDRFKVVNDSLGHEVGDQLLVIAAQRLEACLRPGDTAARLGGDEFTVLLEGVADEREAIQVAERFAAQFEPAFEVGGRGVFVTASIGIALGSPGHRRPTDLLREADIAMYRAKSSGKASYAVFDAAMGASAVQRLELETDLHRAIEREELRLEYQPEIELTGGTIVAMEALVRWRHPERGLVPPAEFIPVAEETGLILPLGRWVLERACRQGLVWHERLGSAAPTVSVNLSVKQFQRPDIVEEIAGVLCDVGLPPGHLTLELTETVMMGDAESNTATLRRLKELGVRLAIDDFGSGYSSLGYLKRFPVDELKIDRAFVGGVGRDPEDTAIVEAVSGLAHRLGMRVTAEGVETAGQLARVREMGCDLGQGYHFSPPLEADAVEQLLVQQPWRGRLDPAPIATA